MWCVGEKWEIWERRRKERRRRIRMSLVGTLLLPKNTISLWDSCYSRDIIVFGLKTSILTADLQ